MSFAPKLSLEKLQWKDARDEVGKVNPEFATIIYELNPGIDYPLFKVNYPFSAEVMKSGCLQILDAAKTSTCISITIYEV
jgi:hypothetical protein